MSAECTGWVYRYSPAKGAAFSVHLALADSANDQHRYELWMRQGKLATKARVSRKAVNDALAWLCEHGLLQLVEHNAAQGSANRYRLLMPADAEPVWDAQAGVTPGATPGVQPGVRGATTGYTGVTPGVTHNPKNNPTQPKETPRALPGLSAEDAFDRFWSAYPRKTAKGTARKAWPAALRAAAPEVIVAGAERYRDDPNRVAEFTAHPATWLRAERWGDEPLPPRSQQRGGKREQPKLDTDRDAEAGRLYL